MAGLDSVLLPNQNVLRNGVTSEDIQTFAKEPLRWAGRQAILLTLARAARTVVASEGLSPPRQACGATSLFCQATGAAQSPADQVLDTLDCGKRQEEGVTLQRHAGVSGAAEALGRPRPLSGVEFQLPVPLLPALPHFWYCDQDLPIPV